MFSRRAIADYFSRGIRDALLLLVTLLATGIAVQHLVQGRVPSTNLNALVLPGLYFFIPGAGCIALGPRRLTWVDDGKAPLFEEYLYGSVMPAITLLYLLVSVVLIHERTVMTEPNLIDVRFGELLQVANWVLFLFALTTQLRLPNSCQPDDGES